MANIDIVETLSPPEWPSNTYLTKKVGDETERVLATNWRDYQGYINDGFERQKEYDALWDKYEKAKASYGLKSNFFADSASWSLAQYRVVLPFFEDFVREQFASLKKEQDELKALIGKSKPKK